MERLGKLGGVAFRIAAPLLTRVGTFIAGVLVAEGVAQEHADLFVNLLGALLAVSLDIAFVMAKRYEAARKERNELRRIVDAGEYSGPTDDSIFGSVDRGSY